jgi:NCS1 family nucleobase:cation symporter-1
MPLHDSDLVIGQGEGRRSCFPHRRKHQQIPWSISWLIMAGITSSIGSQAAGVLNGSDFSRYAKNKSGYIIGTFSCLFITGTLVSLIGLTTTAASQKLFGTVFWNPPDLFMAIMDGGQGSSGSRAAVFFLSLGFGLSVRGCSLWCAVNVLMWSHSRCLRTWLGTVLRVIIRGPSFREPLRLRSTRAGGIDLAGIFPLYINIRRGAIITVTFAWVCQPWQLVNRASTFLSVISSFSIFLAPIMGVMVADFYFIRRMRLKLSELYRSHGDFWYSGGVNWRPSLHG